MAKVCISQKGAIMQNLRNTIFYMKTNLLQDIYICIIVLLMLTKNCLFEMVNQQNHVKPYFQSRLLPFFFSQNAIYFSQNMAFTRKFCQKYQKVMIKNGY